MTCTNYHLCPSEGTIQQIIFGYPPIISAYTVLLAGSSIVLLVVINTSSKLPCSKTFLRYPNCMDVPTRHTQLLTGRLGHTRLYPRAIYWARLDTSKRQCCVRYRPLAAVWPPKCWRFRLDRQHRQCRVCRRCGQHQMAQYVRSRDAPTLGFVEEQRGWDPS